MRATVISLSGRTATVRIDGTIINVEANLLLHVDSLDVVANAIAIIAGNDNFGYFLIGIVG